MTTATNRRAAHDPARGAVHVRDEPHTALPAGVLRPVPIRAAHLPDRYSDARRAALPGSQAAPAGDPRPAPDGGRLLVTREPRRGPSARLLAPRLRRGLPHHHPRRLDGLVRTYAQEPS